MDLTLPRLEDTLLLPGATLLLLELTPHRQEATHLLQGDTHKLQAGTPHRLGATLPLLEVTLPSQEVTPHSLEQEDTPPCHQQVEAGGQLQVASGRREELHKVIPPAPHRDKITREAPPRDKITLEAPPRGRTTLQLQALLTQGMEGGIHKLPLSRKDIGVQSKTFLELIH